MSTSGTPCRRTAPSRQKAAEAAHPPRSRHDAPGHVVVVVALVGSAIAFERDNDETFNAADLVGCVSARATVEMVKRDQDDRPVCRIDASIVLSEMTAQLNEHGVASHDRHHGLEIGSRGSKLTVHPLTRRPEGCTQLQAPRERKGGNDNKPE